MEFNDKDLNMFKKNIENVKKHPENYNLIDLENKKQE